MDEDDAHHRSPAHPMMTNPSSSYNRMRFSSSHLLQQMFFVLLLLLHVVVFVCAIASDDSSPLLSDTELAQVELLEKELEETDRATLVAKRRQTTSPHNEYLPKTTQKGACLQNGHDDDDNEEATTTSATSATTATTCAAEPVHRRSVYPAEEPLVCLAFLSCCGRTDLLQTTMQAAIRHMEDDEPSVLSRHYEIAWVDNGSPPEKQEEIRNTFQIDHALPMPRNMGLAWGMNALLFDLCTAPYIMLMEEDWLYMDATVAEPTPARKEAIARAVALLKSDPVDPTSQRPVKGVFLRTESNIVPTTKAVLRNGNIKTPMEQPYAVQRMEYRISCMNFQQTGHLFGAFSNGASLYDRRALMDIGRMYGEPGDVFSDLSVEPNFSFRVGLQYCAARIPMDPQIPQCDFDDSSIENVPATCAAAFAHIGGGRGTRPARRKHMKCVDDAWNFYGTPYFDVYPKQECSKELPTIWEQLKLNAEFQRVNDAHNEAVFAKEQEQRKLMLQMADMMESKCQNPDEFRKYYGPHDPSYAAMSDEEIRTFPSKLRNMATSEHQLPGFWDILGRPIGVDFDMPDEKEEMS